MSHSPYDLMQMAVDIVASSPHPTNKIAATLSGTDNDGQPYALARTNFWPKAIEQKIGTDIKIGSSSGTIHAETACIIAAPKTKGAKIFVTDPPCPNCVKNIAEAGIKEIYIDHKGFDKDWAKRRGNDFDSMALRICEKSGIAVYEIWRKEKRVEEILEIFKGYRPPLEKPAITKPVNGKSFEQHIESQNAHYAGQPFALALTNNHDGAAITISAEPHLVIGYTSDNSDKPESKYSFALEPINRLIMTAARKGLKIDPDFIYSSRTPTARELVNMIGADLNQITIGKTQNARDEFGPRALKQLVEAEVLNLKH